jgi:hypothetical protein
MDPVDVMAHAFDLRRILLAEEFSTCLERTHEEQLKVNCAESLLTALGSDAIIYKETAVLKLAQG